MEKIGCCTTCTCVREKASTDSEEEAAVILQAERD